MVLSIPGVSRCGNQKPTELLTVALTAQNLGREVFGGTAEGICCVRILHVELAKTEVAKCDVASVVEKDVLWLQVTRTLINETVKKAFEDPEAYRYTTLKPCKCSKAQSSSAA